MKAAASVSILAAVVILAGGLRAQVTPEPAPEKSPAAEPVAVKTMSHLLGALPAETQSFVAFNDIGDVTTKAAMFTQRTGLNIPLQDKSVGQLIMLKVGVQGGVAQRGSAGIVYLDPQKFKDRNTVFIVPTEGRDQFLQYNAVGDPIEAGLYQLPHADQPRFLSFQNDYALFSDSIRTMRAILQGGFGIADRLSDEQREALGRADVYVHLDLHRSLESRRESTEKFRAAITQKVMGDPTLEAYSDLLLGYIVAINQFFEQIDFLDIGLTFGDDELGLSVFVKFTQDGSIHQVLQNLGGSDSSLVDDLPLDRPFISAAGISVSPLALRDAAVAVTDFIMQKSPKSRKSVQAMTRDQLMDSVNEMMLQLTGEFAFMSALPDPKSGSTQAGLAVARLKDPAKFATGLGNVFAAMLKVADEVGARVVLSHLQAQETYRDVAVDYVKPRIEFTSKLYERLFDERAKQIYGPDGFLYRMAIVEDRLYMTVGSDLSLFHTALDRALDKKPPVEAEVINKARGPLPKTRNAELYFSLPAMLTRSVLTAGSVEGVGPGDVKFDETDKEFLESEGVIGLTVGLDGGRIRLDSSVGYDQLAKAMAFMERHLPPMTPPPPTPEPTPEPGTTPGVTPEPAPEPAPTPGVTPEPAPEPSPTPGVTPEPAPEP